MKKILVLIQILISFCSVSQEDQWFPNNGGVWEMKTSYGYPDSFWNNYSVYLSDSTFFFHNDTSWYYCDYGLIYIDSGRVYFKALWGPPGGLNVYIPPYGPSDTITQKLYDFTLNLGDTAYTRDGTFYTVIDIDSTNFLGAPRKTLHLGWGWNELDTWVEGVGSTNGFFYPWAHLFEASCDLCFFTGNYADSLGNLYTLTYDNPSICEALDVEVAYQQNPTIKTRCGKDKLWITLQQSATVKIFSADGKLTHGMKLPAGESVVEFDFLERGAYIIRIGANYAEKFIKQ